MRRQHIFVRGIVQGVGFRPFLYSLAANHSLTGFVFNQSDGVSLEIQGAPNALTAFLHNLQTAPPPLAVVDEIRVQEIPPIDAEPGFRILDSTSQDLGSTPISPDIATCDDCLRELFNPADRRFRYPFINCTNCGPRFTIIRDIPYDRPHTTMAAFPMCELCQSEYDGPSNRRFHAQPNACAVCGPKIWFEKQSHKTWEEHALQDARAALNLGGILAIKGIGGFHLAVDATNESAVARLRDRKGRRDKPFALMARSLDIISRYAFLDEQTRTLLQSRQRPIVLLPAKPDTNLAASVAPGNPFIGFMLPYSPLHHLLLDDQPLVMTSGNLSEEPIVWCNEDALSRLANIADAFLLHNREIHVPCDDSVIITAHNHRELPIRRSRGYSPMPVKLPAERPMTLAVGAELKACFCLTRDNYAYLSQHIGDMENLETLDAFERALDHIQALFRCQPARVICDAHPGYLSTRWARAYAIEHSLPLFEVQHHHAHAMSVMVEHGLEEDEQALTFAFDGTGYGTDGAIWGGEVLLASYSGFQRLAHLRYVPLPGGDSAIRHPARVALAHLFAADIPWTPDLPCVQACSATELRILQKQLSAGTHSVQSSSIGRLFDAVSAFLDVRRSVTYEGQAAIELEFLSSQSNANHPYPITFADSEFDVSPMWLAILQDLAAQVSPAEIAARFHHTLVHVILHYSHHARAEFGCQTVALTGGVFQNIHLLNAASQALTNEGFRVLTHRLVPPNDGGIALGQAMIAS